MYPKSLQALIDAFRMLPGVGERTAERYAFSMLEKQQEEILELADALAQLKENLKICQICGNLSETEVCSICADPQRDVHTICVVQETKDVIALEKMKEYNGVYHVLNGAISASKGKLPKDLNIQSLLERVNEDTKEVILATNPTMEGETTALYLSKLLEEKQINTTRLAHGLPMGGQLDYADERTLSKALENRRKI